MMITKKFMVATDFYAHFEVLHQKRVMETLNLEKIIVNSQKKNYARLRWILTCVKRG